MEYDLNELQRSLENFCKKYNVTIEADTFCQGRLVNGQIAYPKVRIKVEKY